MRKGCEGFIGMGIEERFLCSSHFPSINQCNPMRCVLKTQIKTKLKSQFCNVRQVTLPL